MYLGFGIYLVCNFQTSTIIKNKIFHEISIWIICYLISDFLAIIIVLASLLISHGTLYNYARYKFVMTSVTLIINIVLLGFGIAFIVKLPHNTIGDDELQKEIEKKRTLAIVYLVMRSITILLVSKMQFDLRKHLIP
jgi:hypothetical protein